MAVFNSYLELVIAYNRVVENDTPTSHKGLASSKRLGRSARTDQVRPQDRKQEAEAEDIWLPHAGCCPRPALGPMRDQEDHPGGGDHGEGAPRPYAFQEEGNVPALNERLLKLATCRSVRENFPFTGKWTKRSRDGSGFVPLIGGPEDVRIPDVLAPLLGMAQKSVHITTHTWAPEGMLVWAQTRPRTALHYPGKLDQAASGYLRYAETESEAINRLVHEEIDGNRGIGYEVKWQKPVAYFTVRGDDACQLKGLAEAGIMACRALKVHEDWVPWGLEGNDEVGTFTALTVDEVKESLLNDEWKPGSALAMLRFLIDVGAMTKEDEPKLDGVMRVLYRELPHYMPQGTFP